MLTRSSIVPYYIASYTSYELTGGHGLNWVLGKLELMQDSGLRTEYWTALQFGTFPIVSV